MLPTFTNDRPAIVDYARLLKTGMASLNRIKIYLCGQPEAGKTTLARVLIRFVDPDPHKGNKLKQRTRGIDVMKGTLPSGATYKLWDFAGQADYHVHHDLFMYPEAAVFILLIDLRETPDLQLKHLTYWLRYIVTQCPSGTKPSVLLLATHVDESDAGSSATQKLYSNAITAFDHVVNFVADHFVEINCTDGASTQLKEIEDLLEAARFRFVTENPTPTPLICKQIIDVIEKQVAQEIHYMAWPVFCDVMKEITADTELLSIAALHLHKIGDVFYDPLSRLQKTVIVDLGWLCQEVLGWLFCPINMLTAHAQLEMVKFRKSAENGAVRKQDIPVKHSFVGCSTETMDVLEQFELCYGFEQDGQKMFVFPSILRTVVPSGIWTKQAALDLHIGVIISCNSAATMIPPGFFQRVQVRIKLDIGPKFWISTSKGSSNSQSV